MSAPRDRWGVFLIPTEHEDELLAESESVEAAMANEHGEVGPRSWYEARRSRSCSPARHFIASSSVKCPMRWSRGS